MNRARCGKAWPGNDRRCKAGSGRARHGKALRGTAARGLAWLCRARRSEARLGTARQRMASLCGALRWKALQGLPTRGAAWQGEAMSGEARLGIARLGLARRGRVRHRKARQFSHARENDQMRIAITIEGTTPLICNKFTDAAAQAATKGTRGSNRGDQGTEREIAESKLYLDDKGHPCIPQPNLLSCLVEGGVWHKIGKKQVTTKQSSILYSCLDVIGLMIPIEHVQPWTVDIRPIVIPSTKGRILAYRPRFDDWKLTFEIELMTEIISAKFARNIIDDAGMKVGLGDFRPARKGPYGRFNVKHWQEVAVPLREAAE